MSRDLNQWMGIGRLGKDPEMRTMPNGNAVVNFSIACGDDYVDKHSGEKVDQTEWVNIVAFGRTAEIINQYCEKGKQIFVSGKLRTRKWQDKDGNDRWTTEVLADRIQLLGGKSDGDSHHSEEERPASKPAEKKAEQPFETDIPF
jgi:single-strand DNA-binding protein